MLLRAATNSLLQSSQVGAQVRGLKPSLVPNLCIPGRDVEKTNSVGKRADRVQSGYLLDERFYAKNEQNHDRTLYLDVE